MKKLFSRILFLAIVTVFTISIFGQQGTLNVVDSSFAPEIESQNYGYKAVSLVQAFPDGKILAIGSFSSYNRAPVGKAVRLNADGSLDTTFNTQTVSALDSSDIRARIILQPDGKIVISCRNIVANGQAPKNLIRLNADGTLDAGFNYTLGNAIVRIEVDSVGRLVLSGGFATPLGSRTVVRLNGDGSLDSSFNYATTESDSPYIAIQGSKVIVTDRVSNGRIFRLNENGSEDSSFTPQTSVGGINNTLLVQPDNKILYLTNKFMRLNENGGIDNSMQSPAISVNGIAVVRIANDGKIVLTSMSSTATVRQFLPTGAEDPAFPPYTPVGGSMAFGSVTIQPDGKIIIGDQSNPNAFIPPNNFVRLNFNGTPDPTFNPGGIGFQIILPASIRAIAVQSDGKIVLGGKIDVINDVVRYRLARVNADGTVDTSFQINTSATGDRFSIIRDIYQIRAQSDGKVVVSGWFDYVQGGVAKRNLVRLNSDGSMDPSFSLSELVNDYSEIVGAGRNRFLTLGDGKLLVGISMNNFGSVGPWKYMPDGSRDPSFNSVLNTTSSQMFIDDVVVQPDGKFVVSGSHNPAGALVSYVARLNADGSVDPTFTYSQEPTRLRSLLSLLPDGKILVSKHSVSGTIVGKVERLNANGTPDPSFNSVSVPGIINALLALPNGKFFVGGNFTVSVNGQVRTNLLQFRADGTFDPTSYNVNSEVLCLTLDAEGRLLVGGSFTVIGANASVAANRSYVARLTSGTDFDYDGDGKADISVFRPSENTWYVLRSSGGGLIQQTFAIAGDIPAPADYDGDGKTDMAIYRPSSGDWWYLSSINSAQINVRWGQAGDIPRPSDFDGDGKADFVLYRPSNNVWYRLGTAGTVTITEFGVAEDKPLVGDFDGDGKSDLAVFRPSTGDWWYAASASGGQFIQAHWGQTGDIPVPGDYDGDGKTDVAVFRPSVGGWYIYNSGNGSFTIMVFGTNEDRPVAADYDGDGRADIAVFRPSTGIWHLLQSTAGSSGARWGVATDTPTEGAYIP